LGPRRAALPTTPPKKGRRERGGFEGQLYSYTVNRPKKIQNAIKEAGHKQSKERNTMINTDLNGPKLNS